ncbi:MAG TPA: SRPBCC domain-containing protein [Bacteroidia bacterium]|nr:SRPBCC domain-containing protein [Bacteroidia bacterium]HNT79633.1 SRPBCC domain-containing protein [Bacteroidia bacterium]
MLIHAPKEKVHSVMLQDEAYRKWTAVFSPTSFFRGDWKEGSKMLFIGLDDQGKEGGMLSRIKKNTLGEVVSIEHYGMLKDGEEITSGDEVESWAGAMENYYFKDVDGGTLLSIEMDSDEQCNDFLDKAWPKALEILKSICEG